MGLVVCGEVEISGVRSNGAGVAAIGNLESTSCGKPMVLSRGVTQSDVLVGLEKEGP